MRSVLKSIWAIIAGILVGALLSHITDFALEAAGVLPKTNLYVAAWLVWIVIIYRSIFNALGFFITAKLAPHHPAKHVLVLAIIGTLGSVGAAIGTANLNLGPQWYPWALAVLVPFMAWAGWKFYESHSKQKSSSTSHA